MAFEKKVWLGGDTVTAAHLNRIENGIAEALGSGGSGALPKITPADDGKVMVAQNGEWTNVGLLNLGKEYELFPETEVVPDISGETRLQINVDSVVADDLDLTELSYTATHNGTDYKLALFDEEEMLVLYYPQDHDFTSTAMPEIALTIINGKDPEQVDAADNWTIGVMALPEADSHKLTLKAEIPSTVLDECIPFAIKAGSGLHAISEGNAMTASGPQSHAEGDSTTASGAQSHAEGYRTTASGSASHAEGCFTTASGDEAHAEGDSTTASGNNSHAEGSGTTASGEMSHAEGDSTTASGDRSHAEGNETTASGYYSHAEGQGTISNHASQHVFGAFNVEDPSTRNNSLIGNYIEIVGNGTASTRSNARTLDWNGNEVLTGKLTVGAAPTADMDVATKKYVDDNAGGGSSVVVAGEGTGSTVQGLIGNEGEGTNNTATGDYAHVEGGYVDTNSQTGKKTYSPNTASGNGAHAEGTGTTASGLQSHAEGGGTTASGTASHAEGSGTRAGGINSHAEGGGTNASGDQSHAEGAGTTASGPMSHAEGAVTTASGGQSHTEGTSTTASGSDSHAEGSATTASGAQSHAEGVGGSYTINGTTYESGAKGDADHTEGYMTLTTSGRTPGNHAEGYRTQATGGAAHAEGNQTVASGSQSHAEGQNTTASGEDSHAEGNQTTASGYMSHAEGRSTIANHESQHVFGEYNIADPSTANATSRGTYVEIVGNGTISGTTESRSNARTLDWDGNETLAGSLTLGKGTADEVTVTAAQLKQLIAMLSA